MWENWNRWYNWETINEAHWEASGLIIGNIQHEYFSASSVQPLMLWLQEPSFLSTPEENGLNIMKTWGSPFIYQGTEVRTTTALSIGEKRGALMESQLNWAQHSKSQGLARVRTGESNPNSNWQFPERNLWLRLSMNMTGRRQLAGIPLPRTPFFPVLPPGTLLCFHSTWKIWQKSTYDPCRIREM